MRWRRKPNIKRLERRGDLDGLRAALRYHDPDRPDTIDPVQLDAAQALRHVEGGDEVLSESLVNDPESSVRYVAVRAVSTDVLNQALNDADRDLFDLAAWELVRRAPNKDEKTGALIRVLGTREEAAWMLAELGTQAIQPLIEALESTDPSTRLNGTSALLWLYTNHWQALSRTQRDHIHSAVARLQDDDDEGVRSNASRAGSEITFVENSGHQPLSIYTRHAEGTVRKQDALKHFGAS